MTIEELGVVIGFLESLEYRAIYPESYLDELREAGVFYDRFRGTLFTKEKMVQSTVKSSEQFRAILAGSRESYDLEPGSWKGFLAWELCEALFQLCDVPYKGVNFVDEQRRFNQRVRCLKYHIRLNQEKKADGSL